MAKHAPHVQRKRDEAGGAERAEQTCQRAGEQRRERASRGDRFEAQLERGPQLAALEHRDAQVVGRGLLRVGRLPELPMIRGADEQPAVRPAQAGRQELWIVPTRGLEHTAYRIQVRHRRTGGDLRGDDLRQSGAVCDLLVGRSLEQPEGIEHENDREHQRDQPRADSEQQPDAPHRVYSCRKRAWQ